MVMSKYVVLKTLLAGDPDINRRTVYEEATMTPVARFNESMQVWNHRQERALQAWLAVMNEGSE
jgi:hypothetical protein